MILTIRRMMVYVAGGSSSVRFRSTEVEAICL